MGRERGQARWRGAATRRLARPDRMCSSWGLPCGSPQRSRQCPCWRGRHSERAGSAPGEPTASTLRNTATEAPKKIRRGRRKPSAASGGRRTAISLRFPVQRRRRRPKSRSARVRRPRRGAGLARRTRQSGHPRHRRRRTACRCMTTTPAPQRPWNSKTTLCLDLGRKGRPCRRPCRTRVWHRRARSSPRGRARRRRHKRSPVTPSGGNDARREPPPGVTLG